LGSNELSKKKSKGIIMVAKTKSKEPKSKSTKSARAKPASPKLAKVTPVEPSEQQTKAVTTDEKSIQTLRAITNYLTAILFSYGIGILFNFWQIFTKDSNTPSSALFNIFAFMGLGAILIWCLRLLKQMRMLSFWSFLVFVFANIFCLIFYRLIGKAPIFAPVDIVMYLFAAVAIFELYKLKNNGTLH
jgi:hypothetical protein